MRADGFIDFSRVAVHEIGHIIGLAHENVAPSIMAPVIGEVEVPLPDDVNGVFAIYGGPLPEPPPVDCPPPVAIPLNTSFTATLTTGDCNVAPLFNIPAAHFADLYAITVTSPGHLSVQTSASSFNTFLLLLDAQTLKPIDLDDDDGWFFNSLMVRDLAAGDYVIVASAAYIGVTGTYTLTSSFELYTVKIIDKRPTNKTGALPAIIMLLLEDESP
jgi:hypothetical protein